MSSETLFISDLHLDPRWPIISQRFLRLLADRARKADALYILGDLFEAWIGDDEDDPHYTEIRQAMKSCAEHTPIFVQQGNRDFLLGKGFEADTGSQLIDDETIIDLYDEPVLLMHGDQLCTDDHKYQQTRTLLRSETWQAEVLAKSREERRELARQLRNQSEQGKARQRESAQDIADVNTEAVQAVMTRHQVGTLIHGHTHRPAVHDIPLDPIPGQRIVLPDWTEQRAGLLSWRPGKYQLEIWS